MGLCFLVQQREAALLTARWLSQLQRAAGLMPVGIVALVLPRDALHDAVAFGAADDAWKTFMWVKRTGKVVPNTLPQYKDVDIFIGPAWADGWTMLDDGRPVKQVTFESLSLKRFSARSRCVVELV